jgi:hypothetical protein
MKASALHRELHTLWCRVFLHYVLDLLFVRRAILLEQVECVRLRRRLWVRFVEERLDTEEDLLDGDSGSPAFFFVEDRQADGAGRVYVWVEQRGYKFAWEVAICQLWCYLNTKGQAIGSVHFGGFVGYSSGNVTSSLKRPPSHIVFSLPGTPHSHFLRSIMPFAPRMGFAKKPKGWSRRHCFLGTR